jgi:hypothetical protein
VGHDSTAKAIFEAFRPVSASSELADATLRTAFDRLERVHRFTLSREDEIVIKDAYEAFCGGGPPANKYFENGTFASTETLFCRLHKQVCLDVSLDRLERGRAPA